MKLDPMFAIFNLGGTEIILILAIVLLLFGGKGCLTWPKGLARALRKLRRRRVLVRNGIRGNAQGN